MNFTTEQLEEAKSNDVIGIEKLRNDTHQSIINHLDVSKKFNIIRTSEGLGKSSLILQYKTKFNSYRIIVVCKSYVQLKGKKKLYEKIFPDNKIEIIPGNEKFLNKYNIFKDEYVWKVSDDGGKYIALRDTISEASSLSDDLRGIALEECDYLDSIKKGKTYIDIILMTEKKLEVEVSISKNFRRDGELIIFDEYHQDTWGEYRDVGWEEKGNKVWNRIYGKKIFRTETWAGFHTEMYKVNMDWKQYIKGKVIILTTEILPLLNLFKLYGDEIINVVDAVNVFNTNTKVKIKLIDRNKINSKNKLAFADNLRNQNYVVMGNGIKSKKNHTTILGQNYHDEWVKTTKLALILNQPNPAEIAVIKENTNLKNTDEMSIIRMADVLNQYLGRCCGYRNNVNFKEFIVYIPTNFIAGMINYIRYICKIEIDVL